MLKLELQKNIIIWKKSFRRTDLIEKERKAGADLIFYEEPECAGSILLEEGDFIAVAPEDAHKPRCMAGVPHAVKKVVVKVAVNE